MKKPCLNCGTAFETTYETIKFCSPDCEYRFFLKSKPVEEEIDNVE